MNIILPEFSLVLLIGSSGAGKSTFAKKHFIKSETVSSDFCRKLISDDENDQTVSSDAFDLLYSIVDKRLTHRKFTLVDATNLNAASRGQLKALAKKYHCKMVAIVFDLPKEICQQRNAARLNRIVPQEIIDKQYENLQIAIKQLATEKYRHIYYLRNESDLQNAYITKTKLNCNQKQLTGPFDIIGDIHGCYDELVALLNQLGYLIDHSLIDSDSLAVRHPENRMLIFIGDLVDRGPQSKKVMELVMNVTSQHAGLCVKGNHEDKFQRYLLGKNVQLTHGLEMTAKDYPLSNDDMNAKAIAFLKKLVSHYVLDEGNLIVAHAGLKEEFQERDSGKVLSFALYGDTTGEIDEMGFPIRNDWAQAYHGKAMVVYGHTPLIEPQWINNTICIDTGCVFGGKLTALRYPEKQLVSVSAMKKYYEHK